MINIGLVVDGIRTHDWSQVGGVAGGMVGGKLGGAIVGEVLLGWIDGPLPFVDLAIIIACGWIGSKTGSEIGEELE